MSVPELEQTQKEAMASLAALLGRAPEGFSVSGGGSNPSMNPR